VTQACRDRLTPTPEQVRKVALQMIEGVPRIRFVIGSAP
jgi:hypothetical protein